MRLRVAVLAALAGAMPLRAQGVRAPAVVELRRGMVITKSTTLAKRTYRIAASPSLDSALIVVRGDDITLDLNEATIVGAAPEGDPDRAAGVAIRVEGGRNVTIQRGTIRGYRVGIMA